MLSLVTGVWQGVCFVSSLENTDYNEFRRVFSHSFQQIFSVALKINPQPLPYAFLQFRMHAHPFIYLYIVQVLEVIFELNKWIYNKINYIRQHYLFINTQGYMFRPIIRSSSGLHCKLSHWCCVHIGIPIFFTLVEYIKSGKFLC